METTQTAKKEISNAIENLYFKGIYEGDLNLLKQIYYPGTLLFGDIKDQPYFKNLEQYLDGVKNRVSPKDLDKPFEGEIIDIRVINSIAAVELKLKMYDFYYHEFLSFHKLDGRWLLVNKMLSDTNS